MKTVTYKFDMKCTDIKNEIVLEFESMEKVDSGWRTSACEYSFSRCKFIALYRMDWMANFKCSMEKRKVFR